MKRIVILSIIVLISAFALSRNVSAVGSTSRSGYHILYGDTNLDGDVNTYDVTEMLKYCAGMESFYFMQFLNGDLNCDSVINTSDVGILLRYIAGMIDDIPCSPEEENESDDFLFVNSTFPQDGDRLPFGFSYNINGTILSRHPLVKVSVRIDDTETGETEVFESVGLDAAEGVMRYNTERAINAIDGYVRFAKLSVGAKHLELICSNAVTEGVIVYECTFTMGYTLDEISPYCYDLSGNQNLTVAKRIQRMLNSIDFIEDKGAKIVNAGTADLGETYATMNCAQFARKAVYDGIGITLPEVSVDQAVFCMSEGYMIDYQDIRPGDLFFMSRTYCTCGRYHEIHHVSIYLGNYKGNDYVLESTSSLGGVVMRRLWGLTSGWEIDSVARVWN